MAPPMAIICMWRPCKFLFNLWTILVHHLLCFQVTVELGTLGVVLEGAFPAPVRVDGAGVEVLLGIHGEADGKEAGQERGRKCAKREGEQSPQSAVGRKRRIFIAEATLFWMVAASWAFRVWKHG